VIVAGTGFPSEPVPLPLPPLAAIVTTEGITWFATGVTGQELTADEAGEEAGVTVEPTMPWYR
jgi:hypothetical protein